MKERSKAMKKKKILMIIPAYNEEKNILSVYHTIQKYNKEHNVNYEVLVINDGSTDQTESILKEHQIPYITLVHNLGIGGAVQTGYKYAYEHQYDIAIQFDGDGQHDVAFVKDIIKPIVEEKADFVIGSRFIDKKVSKFQSTKARQLGIRMISATMHLVTGAKIYDTTSGFRAANASIIKEFAKNYPLEYPEPVTTTELLKKGYQVSEIPVSMNERIGGVSSIRSWKNAYYMINVLLSIIMVGVRRYK